MAGFPPEEIEYMIQHINDSKVPEVIVPLVVCGLAAYLAVGLRLFARLRHGIKLGWDDGLIGLALLAYTCYIISFGLTTKYGMGRHIILVKDPAAFAQSALAAQAVYEVTIFSIKASILFLYRRIFTSKRFHIILIILGVFILCNNFAQFIVNILQCNPIAKNWDHTIPGFCIDQGKHIMVEGIINIISDWVILALPIPVLWQLQMNTKKKIQVSLTFLSGGIVCVVSIVRLFYVLQVGDLDASWQDVTGASISTVEQALGIIVACVPTYRVLFAGSARNRSTNAYQYNSNSSERASKNRRHTAELDSTMKSVGGHDSNWELIDESAKTSDTIALRHVAP